MKEMCEMKVNKIDHVSINVSDLAAAKAFFLDIGFEVRAEWEMEGELLDRVLGLRDAKTACVALGAPGSQAWIELVNIINRQMIPKFSSLIPIRSVSGIWPLRLKTLKAS